MIPKDIGMLMDQYLDGSIRKRDLRLLEAWLRRDTAHVDAFVAHVDTDQALRQSMAALPQTRFRLPARNQTPRSEARARWRKAAGWGLALAASAVAAAGLFLYVTGSGPFASAWTLTVTEATGSTTVQRGIRSWPAYAGMTVKPGDRIRTLADATVALGARETGDIIQMMAETELRLDDARDRYALAVGRIEASMTPGMDRSVVFETAYARTLVTGTRFELVAAANLTRVTASEGQVLFSDTGRDVTVEVGAGQASVAAPWAAPTVFPMGATEGLQALYLFNEGQGDIVHDVSGIGTPMDLTIGRPENVEWLPDRLRVRGEAELVCRPVSGLAAAVRESSGFTVAAVWQAKPIDEEDVRVFMNIGFSGRKFSWTHPRLKRMNVDDVGQPFNGGFLLDGRGEPAAVSVFGNGKLEPATPVDNVWSKRIAEGALDRLVIAPTLDARDRRDKKTPWQGDLFMMAVYGRPLSAEEIGRHAQKDNAAAWKPSAGEPDLPIGLGWDFIEPADPETFRVFHGQWRHDPERQCMETDGSELRMQLAIPLRGLPILVEAEVSSSNPKGLSEAPVNPPNLFYDQYEKHAVVGKLRTREEMQVPGGIQYDSNWSRILTSRFYVTDRAIVSVDPENRPREVFLYDRAPLELGARLALRFPVSANAPLNRLHQFSLHSVRPQDVPDVAPFRKALEDLPASKRTGTLALPDPRPGREGAVWVRFFEAGQATPFAAGSRMTDEPQ